MKISDLLTPILNAVSKSARRIKNSARRILSPVYQVFSSLREAISEFTAPAREMVQHILAPVYSLCRILNPYSPLLLGFACAFMLSFGVIFCLVTGHFIPVSKAGMIFGCLLISAAVSAFFFVGERLRERRFYRTLLYIGLPLLIAFVLLLARERLIPSAYIAIEHIAEGYRIMLPWTMDEMLLPENADFFMLCVAAIPAAAAACTVVRGVSPWLAISASVPFYIVSFFYGFTNTAPWATILFFFALALIVVSGGMRSHDPGVAAVHTLRLAVPLAAVMIIIAAVISPTDYEAPDWLRNIQNKAYDEFYEVMGYNDDNEFTTANAQLIVARDSINVEDLGPQSKLGIEVMKVRTDFDDGSFYLRGMTYAHFVDNQWQILTEAQASRINALIANPLSNPVNDDTIVNSEVIVRTAQECPILYIPNFCGSLPVGCRSYGDIYVQNNTRLTEYNMNRGYTNNPATRANSSYDKEIVDAYAALVEEFYLGVDEKTAARLRRIACDAGIITNEEAASGGVAPDDIYRVYEVTEAAESFVRNCAPYSLAAAPMPEGEDFAVWFLTEAESGYCTYYATTAVLLLRSLGIPARMVTGYVVNPIGDISQWITVTTDHAHAWVEYYSRHSGWETLAVTGSPAQPEEQTTTTTTSTATTTASTTTSSSEAGLSEITTTTRTAVGTTSTAHGGASATRGTTLHSGEDLENPEHIAQQKERREKALRFVRYMLVVLLSAAALCAVMWLTRTMINDRRRAAFSSGSNNLRVLEMWRYIERLCHASNTMPPEGIEDIMLKARFSQHAISEEELAEVSRCVYQTKETLVASRSAVRRIIDQYLLFLY